METVCRGTGCGATCMDANMNPVPGKGVPCSGKWSWAVETDSVLAVVLVRQRHRRDVGDTRLRCRCALHSWSPNDACDVPLLSYNL